MIQPDPWQVEFQPAREVPAGVQVAHEIALAREGIERSGDPGAVVDLIMFARYPLPPKPSYDLTSQTVPFVGDERQRITELVAGQFADYISRVAAEFAGLRPLVRNSFGSLTGYADLRPYYYRAGWRCPKQQIFNRIVGPDEGASILGVPIPSGIHSSMQQVLDEIAATMDSNTRDLIQQHVFRVDGFSPRLQADSSFLSNHSFGLALDLDPDWNPQFKSAASVAALKRVTGEDFTRNLVPYSGPTAEQRLAEIVKKIDRASSKLMSWLARVAPELDGLEKKVADAVQTLKAAKKAKERIQAQRELDDVRLERSWKVARSQDLRDLVELRKSYGKAIVDGWAVLGIHSVPIQLITAFNRAGNRAGKKLGARWGGEYEKSKDIMHIELDPAKVIDRNGPVGGIEILLRNFPPPAACVGN